MDYSDYPPEVAEQLRKIDDAYDEQRHQAMIDYDKRLSDLYAEIRQREMAIIEAWRNAATPPEGDDDAR